MTPSEMISYYVKIRNKIEQIKNRQKAELLPYQTGLAKLEVQLLEHLNTNDLNSVAGDGGTAFKQVMTSVTVSDWQRTLDYIRENEQWELLEARVSKSGTLEILEETGAAIPGVKVSQAVVVRVRTT